jgi:hypothetical protein
MAMGSARPARIRVELFDTLDGGDRYSVRRRIGNGGMNSSERSWHGSEVINYQNWGDTVLLRLFGVIGVVGVGVYLLSVVVHLVSTVVMIGLVLLLVAVVYRIIAGPKTGI